ncbi:tyrosine-type recombinase/integrase [Microbacterium sp. 16-032]|uniref:tyrosine-type recombinase/integrase n=1 Tax=Microbacterium sp. 16-032 TaxID=3239808 RepID=UPI0034E2F8A1
MARPKKITDSLGRERKATRRSFGKVERLPSGYYRARYTGPDGKTYSAPMTFTTVTDADAWLATQRAAIVAGTWTPSTARGAHEAQADRSQTLAAYATSWISTRTNARGDHLKPRTQAEYERLLRLPDPAREGDQGGPLAPLALLPLIEITPARVRTWRANLLATGAKTQTSRAYGLLNAIMRTAAEDDRIIDTNPCTVKGGQSTHTGRKVVPPTETELEAIVSAITPRFRALVTVAAWGGLRYGEATALRAKDVTVERDEAGGVIAVRINVGRAVTHSAGQGFVVGSTKSEAGLRPVAIFGQDAEIVADHVRGMIGDALLFPAADGVSFLSQSAFWKHWNAARTAAGRPDMPFHALRHHSATAYAEAGATAAENNARHGWSTATVGMRYQHATDRADQLAARMRRHTPAR